MILNWAITTHPQTSDQFKVELFVNVVSCLVIPGYNNILFNKPQEMTSFVWSFVHFRNPTLLLSGKMNSDRFANTPIEEGPVDTQHSSQKKRGGDV